MNKQEWIEKFKLAIIKEDIDTLEHLLGCMNLDGEKLPELKALLEEAHKLVYQKKENLVLEIKKLQRASTYIK